MKKLILKGNFEQIKTELERLEAICKRAGKEPTMANIIAISGGVR